MGKPLLRRGRFSTSGFLTPGLILLLCVALLAAAFERGRGHYQRLRSHVVPTDTGVSGSFGPGGQPPLVVRRTISSGNQPEFISVTLLPGRGMNVLQLTATVPGRGEIPLLFSPDTEEISQILTASGPDAYGAMSSTLGGAIAVPWAGQLTGVSTVNHSGLQGVWRGQRLTFPAAAENSAQSTEGLLLNRGADSVETSSIPGGKAVQSVFHAGNFSGSWPSDLDVSVETELTARDFELAIVLKNSGSAPTPVGVGWHPYFALAESERAGLLLSIPSTQRLIHDDRLAQGTSAVVPVAGTAFDFSSPRGTPLGMTSLNTTYVHLQHGILADGPVVELRHPAAGYALRLTSLSDSIRFLRVSAPAGQPWISISPVTNLDDALHHGNGARPDEGLDVLQPGESLRWRIRLEIVPLTP